MIALLALVALLSGYLLWPEKAVVREAPAPRNLPAKPTKSKPDEVVRERIDSAAPVPSKPIPVQPAISSAAGFVVHVRVWTRDGEPAADASITCRPAPDQTDAFEETGEAIAVAQTDENGQAACPVADPGVYIVHGALGDLAASHRVRLDAGSPAQWVDLVLSEQLALSGLTVDGSGKPLGGVSVSCLSRKGGFLESTVSDEQGNFEIGGLPSGVYYLRAELDGRAPAVLGPVPPGDALRLVLSSGAQLEIHVRDEGSGSPVSAMHLLVTGLAPGSKALEATTDGLGAARFAALASGAYNVQSRDPSYTLVPPVQRIEVAATESTRVELVAGASGSLTGRVIDEDTGAPIPDVGVSAGLQEKSNFAIEIATTDASGTFSFSGLPAGIYGLHVNERPEHYGGLYARGPVGQDVKIAAGEHRDDVVFTLHAGATLRGRVVFRDGTPAPGATVQGRVPSAMSPESSTWAERAVSDDDGYFTLKQVPEDEPVLAQARLRAACSEEIGPLAASRDGGLAVTLELPDVQTGNLSGRVVDESGDGVFARVGLMSDDSQLRPDSVRTDYDGYFFYPDLPTGEWMFSLARAESGFIVTSDSAGPVQIVAGQTTRDVTFVLRSSGLSISGIVLDAEGVPVPKYMLEAEIFGNEGTEFYSGAITDDNGRFTMENVHEGTYFLYNSPVHAVPWKLRVNAGDDVEIRLPTPDKFEEAEPGAE